MKLEKLYKKLEKKFSRYYNWSYRFKWSYRFNGSINKFTYDPYIGLSDNKHQEIIVKLISNKEDLIKFIEDLKKHLDFVE